MLKRVPSLYNLLLLFLEQKLRWTVSAEVGEREENFWNENKMEKNVFLVNL